MSPPWEVATLALQVIPDDGKVRKMSLLNFAQETVVTIAPDATIEDAAKKMTSRNVGCLVVTAQRKPIGILTDRDIVTRVTAYGKDPKSERVETAMTKNPVTLGEELGLFEALETMKDKGVRRFPITDPHGNLSGFFTVDDVLYLLGLEMSAVTRIIEHASS